MQADAFVAGWHRIFQRYAADTPRQRLTGALLAGSTEFGGSVVALTVFRNLARSAGLDYEEAMAVIGLMVTAGLLEYRDDKALVLTRPVGRVGRLGANPTTEGAS